MADETIVLGDFDKFLRNLFTVSQPVTLATGVRYTLVNNLPSFFMYVTFFAVQTSVTTFITLAESNGGDLIVFNSPLNTLVQLNFGLLPMKLLSRGSNLTVRHNSGVSVDLLLTAIGFLDDTIY